MAAGEKRREPLEPLTDAEILERYAELALVRVSQQKRDRLSVLEELFRRLGL